MDLSFLTDLSWRQFRFLLPTGLFWKVPVPITNSKRLNQIIIQQRPLDVYYSSSCWLNPINVGVRSENISKNLFISADLPFDVDGKSSQINDLEKARKETIALYNYLVSLKIKIKYISFSGSKGFHIVCKDPYYSPTLNPIERERKTLQKRKELTQTILSHEIKIDSRVSTDTRRILRVPGTINSKSGFCCRILSPNELYLSIKDILKNTKRITLSALTIPRGDDPKLSVWRKILGLYRNRARSNPPPFYIASFLSNRVVGTKLFIPIIEFKNWGERRILMELESGMRVYQLTDAFLFSGDFYFAILPNPLQHRRVEKILKAFNSTNYANFKKYNQTLTRITPKMDSDLNILSKKVKFYHHIRNSSVRRAISASHIKFLKEIGVKTGKSLNTIGKNEYIIFHTLKENF